MGERETHRERKYLSLPVYSSCYTLVSGSGGTIKSLRNPRREIQIFAHENGHSGKIHLGSIRRITQALSGPRLEGRSQTHPVA